MKLTVLFLGRCDVDKGRLLTPGIGDGEHILIPIPAFLVETEGKRILIDTGMHPVHIDDPDHTFRDQAGIPEILRPVMAREDTLEHRLGELGLGVEDITHVVNSHLHFDHCGQNYLFANGTPIYVQQQHYEAALAGSAFPGEYFDIEGLDYQFIDGEMELFRGIRTIMSSGHAPYHMSFLLDLPNTGKLLLAIDAIFVRDNITYDAWGSQPDPESAKESAHRLKRIAEQEGAMLVCGHDPHEWENLRKAPEFYD